MILIIRLLKKIKNAIFRGKRLSLNLSTSTTRLKRFKVVFMP